MELLLLLLSFTAIAIGVDLLKDTEFTSIASLAAILLIFLYDYSFSYILLFSLLIITKSLFQIVKLSKIIKMIGFSQILKSFMPIAIYIGVSLAMGFMVQRIVLPMLDIWTSSTMFILIVVLSLALITQSTLDALSSIGFILSRNLDDLIKGFKILTIVLGIIAIVYSIITIKVYTVVSFSILISLFLIRKKFKKLKKLNTHWIIFLFLTSMLFLSIIVM